MHFLSLPAEIILSIASFVGGDYIRAKADRLLVCKSWYSAAQSVAFEDLTFTIDTLQRFLAASNRVHSLIAASIRHLDIEGRNFGECDERDGEIISDITEEMRTQGGYESLTNFAAHLPQMTDLKSFRLKMLMKSTTSKWLENLWIKSVVTLISSFPKSLTSITIDNPGASSRFSLDSTDIYHICPLLLDEDLLPSLRHLRIRTRSLCPKVFELKNSNHQLETLVINLSLSEIEIYCAHHTRYCTESIPADKSLYLDILDAAKTAVVHLPALTTLRVLRHKLPSLQVTSHDVISNRTVVLPGCVRWDDVDWVDDGATDRDADEQLDVDLFDGSSSDMDSLEAEATFQ